MTENVAGEFPKAGAVLGEKYASAVVSWIRFYSTSHVSLRLSDDSSFFAHIIIMTKQPVLHIFVRDNCVVFQAYEVNIRTLRLDDQFDSIFEEVLIRWLSSQGSYKGPLVHLLEGLETS